MKHLTLTALSILMSLSASAQTYFQVETDLLDPAIAKGGSLFLTVGSGSNAVSIGGGANELPKSLNDQSDDFTEKRNYQLTLEYQRFFKENAKGFYVGANTNYSSITIKELATASEADLDVFRVGVVVGYIWNPWKKLIIHPFANPRVSFGLDETSFASGQKYKGETFAPFGGLKVGWRF